MCQREVNVLRGKTIDVVRGETSDFSKRLIALILPITCQQFMLALVSASDALMLGMISQNALSAVSLASQITFVQNLFLATMTIGLSMFAAQYWGKNDKVSVEKIFAYVMKITAAVSFVFFFAGLCIPNALMHIFTNEKDLIDGGVIYLRTVSLSLFLSGVSQIYLCILKNSSKAVTAGIISSVSVIVNIFLNAVFIFGLLGFPKLEIAGAALATVIAKLIETVWCMSETLKKHSVHLKLRYILKSDRSLKNNFWKYTLPVLVNEIVWGVGFTMYSVIMGHLGTDAVAANSIANIIKNLIVCFCIGLGSGGGIMVGNELGAGRFDIAKKYGRKLCHLAIVFGIVSGLVMFMTGPLILKFNNMSSTANYYLKWMIVMCSVYMVGKSVNTTIIAGIFCAGGDSKFGFICDSVTMWCITVPLGFIAAFVLKLPVLVVYLIINLDEMIKLPAVYKHYKKYLWVRLLIV